MKFFKKNKKNSKDKVISQVVILAMVFGFAAGVVGQIVADVYIDPYNQDYLFSNYNTNTNDSQIIPELRRVKRFLGIEQDFEVNNSISKISPSLISIYPKKSPSVNPISQIYLPDDINANGFILTSDGWIVSLAKIFGNTNSDNLVVIHNDQVFNIEELIVDSTTGVAFIKIPANNLPVVALGDSDEANLGQLEIVLNDLDQAVISNIKSTSYKTRLSGQSFILSSERYDEFILLTDSIETSYLGSPLINLAGEVIGIINEIDENLDLITAVPINQFRSVILDVLRSNIVKRSYLGVEYLDLAKTVGLSQEVTQGLNRGALVYEDPIRTSPASQIGIRKGDIIISIDGQPVDRNSSLTELVQQYQPGDEIAIEIVRSGETTINSVVLGILEE